MHDTTVHSNPDSKEKSAMVGSIAGFADTLITLAASLMSNSSVILADTFKTFIEFFAVFISWIAVRCINRGKSQLFNYGLHKLENLSGLFISLFMLVCLLIITVSATIDFLHPRSIKGVGIWISYSAQVLYAIINTVLYLRCKKMSKASFSPLLESQAKLFFTKAFGNLFIFTSLTLSMIFAHYSWSHYIDPAASMIIGLTICVSAFGMFKSSFIELLDKTLEESDQIVIIKELAKHFDDYETIHGIRSRRAGSSAFIEIFLEFPQEMKVSEVQNAIDHIRNAIEEKIAGSKVIIGLTTRPEK